jgi:drug/metabolite transporter (DMT)-like permease
LNSTRSNPAEPEISSPTTTGNLPKGHLLADLCLLATATMWGCNIPIVKDTTTRIDPFVFNAARLTLATLALGLFAWIESRRRAASKQPFPWGRFAVFSALTGFIYMVLFMLGISRTTAGNVALLLSSMPMWTAIFSYFFIGERLHVANWIGLAITFVGTLAVITMGAMEEGRGVNLSTKYLAGNLLILLAAMTWASGTLVSKKLLDTVGPMKLAFMSAAFTTPLHLLIVANTIGAEFPKMLEPIVMLEIIYSGVFSTGLAYALWHVGVRQLGGSHASIFQNFVTLMAVTVSWLFLGEKPTLPQLIGGIAIIIGVLVMRRGRR